MYYPFYPAVDVNCWQDFVFMLFLFVLSAYFCFGYNFIVFVYKSGLYGLKIALFLILWCYVRCDSITLAYKPTDFGVFCFLRTCAGVCMRI